MKEKNIFLTSDDLTEQQRRDRCLFWQVVHCNKGLGPIFEDKGFLPSKVLENLFSVKKIRGKKGLFSANVFQWVGKAPTVVLFPDFGSNEEFSPIISGKHLSDEDVEDIIDCGFVNDFGLPDEKEFKESEVRKSSFLVSDSRLISLLPREPIAHDPFRERFLISEGLARELNERCSLERFTSKTGPSLIENCIEMQRKAYAPQTGLSVDNIVDWSDVWLFLGEAMLRS